MMVLAVTVHVDGELIPKMETIQVARLKSKTIKNSAVYIQWKIIKLHL